MFSKSIWSAFFLSIFFSVTIILAPFSGVITNRYIQVGARVNSSTQLYELIKLQDMIVRVFIPGQYLTLEVIINNLKVRRSYSICSGTNDSLRVGIKKVSGGVFSAYAVDKIKSGDLIRVGTPEGRFQYKSNSKKETITGIAAGSGITPILSIAYSVLNSNKENEFRLIYGNKSLSQEMFTSEINTLKILYSERLKVINVYSQSNEDESKFGRIDKSIINYYNKEYGIADKYFICGPEAMIFSISDELLTNKVSKNNIIRKGLA